MSFIQIGICYLPPPRNTQCGAAPISNSSRLVLGAGLVPSAVGSLASMQSAPLTPSLQNTQSGASKTTLPSFPEFRTNATGASIPVYGANG